MSDETGSISLGTQLARALCDLPLLGDDLYLRMQATNLGFVDDFLVDLESRLLREYRALDRTPLESAAFVSALSQLWIFGVYELLRTWRQKVREAVSLADLLKSLSPRERETRLQQERDRIRETSPYGKGLEDGRWRIVERISDDPGFVDAIRAASDKTESVFRRIEGLRVHLAKHEVPKAKGTPAFAPGYGRINMENGSIYYEFLVRPPEVDVLSRRDVADSCRDLGTDKTKAMLPDAVRSQLRSIAEIGYGAKQVIVTLNDGTEFEDVFVLWDREVSSVGRHPKLPFDARDVVRVRAAVD
jgi:hypothetical protein